MPQYEYRAINQSGQEVSGVIQADEEKLATKQVEEKGLHLFDLKEKEEEKSRNVTFSGMKSRGSNLILFTKQLANLLQAGVQLGDALKIISQIFKPSQDFKEVVEGLYNSLKEGKSFGEALSAYPGYFSQSYISMIKAGEESGFLATTCRRIAENLESKSKLKSFIISSLIYPAVMVVVAIIAIGVMLGYVFPKFLDIYESYDRTLPFITRILLNISNFISAYWIYLLGGIVLIIAALTLYFQSESGKKKMDQVVLKIPVLRSLINSLMINRLASSMGNMLKNGVPLLKALQISRRVVSNTLYKQALQRISLQVERGGSLAEAMGQYDLFDELVVYMIGVGEQTGNLADMMVQIEEQFREKYKNSLERLMKLFEPLLILVVGCIIGLIVIAMMLPILGMGTMQL